MGNGTIKYLKKALEYFLNIIYYREEKCIICGRDLFQDSYLCASCSHKIKRCHKNIQFKIQNNKVKVYSALYYSNAVKEIVLKLKYKSDFKCGDILAKYMMKTIEDKKIDFDIITYVPLSLYNKKKRGYNQSEYLAKCIGRVYDKKVMNMIEKSRKTKDQIGLNHQERWNNLKDSFQFKNNKTIINKKILLIDDVITTGATAYYCALELIKNSSGEITVLTAAKSRI